MSLKDKIKSEIIKTNNDNTATTTYGFILEYSQKHNLAKIQYHHPSTYGKIIADNVRVEIPSGGVCSAGPFPGDKVKVTFRNGNFNYPIVSSVIDDSFYNNTMTVLSHEKEGSLYPFEHDSSQERKEYTTTDSPNINKYLEPTGNSDGIYNTDSDPIKKMEEKLIAVSKFNTAEIGLVHPFNKASLHIRDNAIIDLFTLTNNGMRIDPIEQSIKRYTNTIKEFANDLLTFITHNIEHEVGNDFRLLAQNDIYQSAVNLISLLSQNDILVNAENEITVNSSDVVFNTNNFTINASNINFNKG